MSQESAFPFLPVAVACLVAVAGLGWLLRGSSRSRKSSVQPALDTKEFRAFPLVEKRVLSPNTALYRFALPHKDQGLDLPVGQHVSAMAMLDGKQIMRSYTPTSLSTDRGFFDLVVKSYETGLLSKHFGQLQLGDTLEFRGPKGNFLYTPNLCRALGMIAGGTGITPMLQVARAILENPKDRTEISLIFANVRSEDILLKEELDALAKQHSQFRVYYVLNQPPTDRAWTGGVGFVSKEMVQKHCPAPADDVKMLLCGPPPMIKAMQAICEDLGFALARTISKLEDQIFKF